MPTGSITCKEPKLDLIPNNDNPSEKDVAKKL